jgi:pimeloyl-ACP methyl ester carboxylesterase
MSTQTKPSIVFAHGIWADGSCFNKVIPALQADGYEVASARYGLDTNVEDVAATVRTLGRVSSPAILVGHSYGGAVITAAGTNDRVVGLVYIAALGPDETETSQGQQDKFPTTDIFHHVDVADGRAWMQPSGAQYFCGDLVRGGPEADLCDPLRAGRGPVPAQRPGRRVADEAELGHCGQERPHRPPRPRSRLGQAHGRHHL